MVRHEQAQTAMPDSLLVVVFHRRKKASPIPARQSWFFPGGTHLIVMKNLLPSGTHCGI
jgi:hypothetical protein